MATTPSDPAQLSKLLTRVRALLARAGHPTTPVEEARTSGVIAARLICQHKLVAMPESMLDRIAAEPPPRKPEPTPAPQKTARPAARKGIEFRVITARFPGWCRCCHQSYDEGEAVAWARGIGCTHYGCREYWATAGKRDRRP